MSVASLVFPLLCLSTLLPLNAGDAEHPFVCGTWFYCELAESSPTPDIQTGDLPGDDSPLAGLSGIVTPDLVISGLVRFVREGVARLSTKSETGRSPPGFAVPESPSFLFQSRPRIVHSPHRTSCFFRFISMSASHSFKDDSDQPWGRFVRPLCGAATSVRKE